MEKGRRFKAGAKVCGRYCITWVSVWSRGKKITSQDILGYCQVFSYNILFKNSYAKAVIESLK